MKKLAKNWKLLFTVCFIFGLVGCGKIEEVTVRIARVETESTEWGCIGGNKKTYVKTDDNRMDTVCGEWGKPGDEIKGYWRSGSFDPAMNGFRMTN